MADFQRRGTPMTMMLLDVDHFKKFNDTHGHQAGDAAIKEFACRMAVQVRKTDTAARLGGDEFGVVLSFVEGREVAQRVAQRVSDKAEQPFEFNGKPLPLEASVGLAIYPEDGEQPDALLEVADQAMYAVKRGGRAHWKVSQEGSD